MRAAVLFFGSKVKEPIASISQGLAAGMEKQGCTVDIIDGNTAMNPKLAMYQYIAVGAVGTTLWGGRVPEKVTSTLKNSGMVSGKRCFAFSLRKGIRPGKTLSVLMKIMEREGMYLKFSDLFSTPEEAKIIGSKLHIQ